MQPPVSSNSLSRLFYLTSPHLTNEMHVAERRGNRRGVPVNPFASHILGILVENWRFSLRAKYARLRTSADVATRPWRTPRLACRLSRTVMHPGVWKISCPASRRFCRPSTEQVNYSKMPLQIARAGSAVHELQMTPAARLRRAARAICNRFGGCATVVRAISRQCAATRRIADGAIPSVSCGQPGHPLHFTA